MTIVETKHDMIDLCYRHFRWESLLSRPHKLLLQAMKLATHVRRS